MVCHSRVHLLSLSDKEDITCDTLFGGYLFLQLTWGGRNCSSVYKLLGAYQLLLFLTRIYLEEKREWFLPFKDNLFLSN